MVRIAVDAMGGDYAPAIPVAGALEALAEFPSSCHILLVGCRDAIDGELRVRSASTERIEVVDAPETIGMHEPPLAAIRSRRRSSIRVGLELLKEGRANAFLSAGNTGAVMAASTLVLGLHSGVERPAIGTLFPTRAQPVLVLDAGANVDCTPRELRGFAHAGSVYARDVLGRVSPSVGMLNIGEEAAKGSQAVREAYELLRTDPGIRFVGNVEGRDILAGDCDVVVCDGFVGNVLLKFYESVAHLFTDLLEREMDRASLEGPAMRRILKVLDYSEYGGAPLLGVRGVSVICHGASPARAIKNGIGVALQAIESGLTDHIGAEFAGRGVA